MKRKILVCLLVLGLGVGTATAQLGNGIVYDPTNYHNALLRYYQLAAAPARTPEELRQNHRTTQSRPSDGAVCEKHAGPIQGLVFTMAKSDLAQLVWKYRSWINGINTGVLPNINTGYLQVHNAASPYSSYELSGMDSD